jgi:signal transduction histidine kinase
MVRLGSAWFGSAHQPPLTNRLSLPIIGDSAMICTVVRNLLTNAVKFTPAGGEVTLRIETPTSRHCEEERRSNPENLPLPPTKVMSLNLDKKLPLSEYLDCFVPRNDERKDARNDERKDVYNDDKAVDGSPLVKTGREFSTIHSQLSTSETKYIVSVTDTGIGMTAEQLNNLFRLDHKSARRGTDGETGSGLGLIVCKELIEKHGSTLHIESEPAKGSRFWFEI